MESIKRKVIFFDRDGIVNHRIINDYIKTPEEFVLKDYFADLFKLFKEAGYLAIIITNQQGIGKGIMSIKELNMVHTHMQNLLIETTGFKFDDIYFCVDLKESNSFRRKPNPGMIFEAIEKWNISASESWMFGDQPTDTAAGRASGVKTALIGYIESEENFEADLIFKDLQSAFIYFEKEFNL
ncbi:MAG: histidinol-phosphate phosphatase family protein [Ignavibacteria bacterium]|nr:histidinol-phosphate phosphatase family protein [Ignavibacteria bacterium]